MKNNKSQKQKIQYIPPLILKFSHNKNYCANGTVATGDDVCTQGRDNALGPCVDGVGAKVNCNPAGQCAGNLCEVGNFFAAVCGQGTGE